MARNLIVSGLPRSGTTLLAALIDSSPDAICVSEPDWPIAAAEQAATPNDFTEALIAGYREVRAQIALGVPIDDLRNESGSAVSNYLVRNADGSRTIVVRAGQHVRATPAGDYVLAVKHNALFLSVLPQLSSSRAFEMLTLIRHPREVFASWLDVPFPVASARLPVGEKFWPELREVGAVEAPLPRRMAMLYELLLRRIVSGGVDKLIRYEDIVERTGDLFVKLSIAPGDADLAKKQERATSTAVDHTMAELRARNGIAQDFYAL